MSVVNFMARQTRCFLANVHAINENGQSSVDIDRINHQTVNVEAVNFSLPKREGSTAILRKFPKVVHT